MNGTLTKLRNILAVREALDKELGPSRGWEQDVGDSFGNVPLARITLLEGDKQSAALQGFTIPSNGYTNDRLYRETLGGVRKM